MGSFVFSAFVAIACVFAIPPAAASARQPSTSPPDVHRLVIDPKGDGFDLATCSPTTKHRSPSAKGDDRILAIDVATASKLGFQIAPLEGSIGSAAAIGGNLRVTPPRGMVYEPSSAWDMFVMLDTNRDGVLDASDLVWPALRVARDVDGDGRLDGAELELVGAIDAIRFGPRSTNPPTRDAYGNELAAGAFEKVGSVVGAMVDARLAACDAAKQP